MVQGYNKLYEDLNLEINEVFSNIELFKPLSIKEYMELINNLKEIVKKDKNNKKVRLVVVDSLSMPILCCIDDQLKRPYYFSKILNELHKLALEHDLAVIVTNEIVTQVDNDGTPYFAAAGGQHVADYACVKLELTSLANEKFATRLIKSPIMPEVTVTFKITEDGIRNVS